MDIAPHSTRWLINDGTPYETGRVVHFGRGIVMASVKTRPRTSTPSSNGANYGSDREVAFDLLAPTQRVPFILLHHSPFSVARIHRKYISCRQGAQRIYSYSDGGSNDQQELWRHPGMVLSREEYTTHARDRPLQDRSITEI